jgi:ribonuclease HI
VKRVLSRLAKKKASGPDQIPNEILTICAEELADPLASLFNRCIREDRFPRAWRIATTVIIRKFGKPDYTNPGAYRPIALLSTISKVFESTIADRLTFWAETKYVIPDGHLGGRRGKGCEDACLALTMWVKRKWREGKTVTALFLDVKSAYPSVNPRRLVHSLRQKGCPAYLWKIIERFLEDRLTKLRLADYESAEFAIDKGLPQGSPLSVILYILYNSDLLLRHFDFDRDEFSLGFIDDVVHLTAGKTVDEARYRLDQIGEKSLQWGRSHGAIFDSKKAQFMIFTHSKAAKSPLTFDNQELTPQREVKWLGLWFDEKLTFGKQHAQVKKKADDTLGQLLKIGSSTWGIREQERGLLISAVLVPRTLYGVQIWLTSLNKQKILNILDLIEHSAARFALGALKSTPIKYLNKHRPFRSIKATAENRITNFYLTKLTRLTHRATAVEKQIRTELMWTARPFPSPVHASLNREVLAELASKKLETVNFILEANPPWQPEQKMDLIIDKVNKQEAKREVTSFLSTLDPASDLVLFTDGSAHPEEGLGASAVSSDGCSSKLAFLGPPGTASNFECELVGIRLGLEIGSAAKLPDTGARLFILTDSQAAIDRLKTPKAPKSGQYLLSQIQAVANTIPLSTQIVVRWCPGHVGILGNKLANRKAAEARNTSLLDISIKGSIAAEKSRLIRKEKLWRGSPRMSFPVQSAIHQLRSGHVHLNAFLFKCKRAPLPICLTCGVPETVDHYLVSCARFTEARVVARGTLHSQKIRTITTRTLLHNPRAFKATESFLELSARLPHFRRGDETGDGIQ